ncbi:MAG: MoxR family ATPase, partial [Myxococcota bacterium]
MTASVAPLDQLPRAIVSDVMDRLDGVVRGKRDVIESLLIGVLAGGHILIEDVPGVGKTTLAKALSQVCDIDFTRVQFTPDLLPSDILGTEILNPKDGTLTFHEGPIFTHVLLADEINRASPRTQSALLEAMNEYQVSIEGQTRPLPRPFFVLATQNPVDFEGTYPLPEAQLDRFLLRLRIGYPQPEDELAILLDRRKGDPLETLRPVIKAAQLRSLQQQVRNVEVAEHVARYVLDLAAATRAHPELELGVSTRGALAMMRAAQARALVCGRDYVVPDDVQALAPSVFAHRLMLRPSARYGGTSDVTFVEDVLAAVSVP